MEIRETAIDRIQGEEYLIVYTNETKYMNKLKKLHDEYPDLVCLTIYEDGIDAKVPNNWFKFVSPKRGANATEEQKIKMNERMAKARQSKRQENES